MLSPLHQVNLVTPAPPAQRAAAPRESAQPLDGRGSSVESAPAKPGPAPAAKPTAPQVEKPFPAEVRPVTEVEKFWQITAREALKEFHGGGRLLVAEQAWLTELESALGRAYAVIPDPDAPGQEKVLDTRLTVDKLNASPEKREALANTLKAMLQASQEPPLRMRLGQTEIPVHNREVGSRMASGYTAESFDRLFSFCEESGVFGINVHPETGLIRTSGGAENVEMAGRQWVTDTVRCGEIERHKAPAGWKQALSTLAKFYAGPGEAEAFDKAIRDPESYRQGGPEEGVAHIFIPDTMERDPAWFNNKRLESHGLALKAMCDTIVDGVVHGKPWGFEGSIKVSDQIVDTISRMASMFGAIDYSTAPAVGNWEETPFAGGLTWDTESMRSGLESVHDLMHNPEYDANQEIQKIRQRLAKAPYGEFLTDAEGLKQAIGRGQERVRQNYMAESPGIREMDSSLTFLAQSTIRLHDDPVKDVEKHLELLDAIDRHLVRDNGMIRYEPFQLPLRDGSVVSSPDSYLSMNYTVAADKDGKLNLEWADVMKEFGSKDASEPDVFAARAALSSPNKEAEWFMVSDLAHGYARQINKLLDHIGSRPADAAEKALIDRARQGAERSINRAFARITGAQEDGTPRAKANGRDCPALAVPEAYAHVSSLQEGRPSRPIAGENTPLMWAASSLYAASNEFASALARLES